MATQDDITIANGDEEMAFHCRACRSQFATMPLSEVHRERARGTLDQRARLIVAEHIKKCPGPAEDAGGKKVSRPHKA